VKGDWQLMVFKGNDAEGKFVSNIIDPLSVVQMPDGQLSLKG
jgi:hypothetical protein